MKNNKNLTEKGLKSTRNYFIKFLLLVLVIKIGDYRQSLHPDLLLALYSCHVYFSIEIVLAILAAPVLAIFGIETEPQFNEPYLATSLQDFWGKRWNLMATNILRPTIYIPIQNICKGMVGAECAKLAGVMATFLVSGLMHELIYFYVTHLLPTWEVMWYFVLQGVYTSIEIVVKKASSDRLQLRFMTIPFLLVTNRLFFAQIIRNGMESKLNEDYSVLVEFVKGAVPWSFSF
ncbi:Acyl-coa--sterol o-acyltransferase [Thalictrum thalictroides]|uniref:Acyl-coa--sterol o-acyltransferase n=1 Tax=Thalictrum thalictroides TaxID=46969 RepID=A0A7J6URS2_THATH|nr:Acyl-coa--sterol o-acyltransferase [Thalictrum thalictroides]